MIEADLEFPVEWSGSDVHLVSSLRMGDGKWQLAEESGIIA
ncbi:MAG: hypothetical protein R6W74_08510 [Nitrosomonas halophila]|jgi:hypothetical protein